MELCYGGSQFSFLVYLALPFFTCIYIIRSVVLKIFWLPP